MLQRWIYGWVLLTSAIYTDVHVDICSPFYQSRTSLTIEEKRLSLQKHPGVCADMIIALAPFHHVPVAKRARRGTLLEGTSEAAEKFGPLKVVLGAIPAVYANREVRSQPPSRDYPLIRASSTGIDRCGKQDRKPPLTCSCIGRTFRFASR